VLQTDRQASRNHEKSFLAMRGWMKLVLVILSLIVLYWPGIQYHWETAKDPYFVPYDASQYIPAFFKYDRTDPIPTTYAKEYYLNAVCPALYKWSTAVGAHLTDVRHFQLGMMYLAYAVFLGVLGRLAWVLGGPVLSFAVLALTISAWIFIGLGFIGGAPRMYAYPLITLVLYALILDRPYLLAATAVLGALLYPIVAMISGSCLAGWLILKPFSAQGSVSHWPLWRRLTIVALAGSLTIAVAILLMLGSKPYDRRVVEADVAAYPEAGPDGNYRPYDSLPYKLFGVETFTYFVGPLYSHGDPMAGSLNIHKNLDRVNFLFALAVMGLIVVLVIQSGMKTILKNHRYGGIRADRFLRRLRYAPHHCLARGTLFIHADSFFHVLAALPHYIHLPLVTLLAIGPRSSVTAVAEASPDCISNNYRCVSCGIWRQGKCRVCRVFGGKTRAAAVRCDRRAAARCSDSGLAARSDPKNGIRHPAQCLFDRGSSPSAASNIYEGHA
jgi:hypothetical protein